MTVLPGGLDEAAHDRSTALTVLPGGLDEAAHDRSILRARCLAYLSVPDDWRNPYLRSLAPAARWDGHSARGVGDRVGAVAVPAADLAQAVAFLPHPWRDLAELARHADRERGWPGRWDEELRRRQGKVWTDVRDAPGRPFSLPRAIFSVLGECADRMAEFLGTDWMWV